MKKGLIIGALIIAAAAVITLSAYDREVEKTSGAEAVIREYHHGLLNRDFIALQGLLARRGESFVYEQSLDGLSNVEILSIKEDKDAKDWYIREKQGKDSKPENIMAFEVKAEFDYQNYASLYYMSGVQKRKYFLVREKESSPWLIEYIKLI